MKRSLGLLLALCPIGASAFVDDFLGTQLNSYWYIDRGEFHSNWTYNVADSWLNVTDVYGSGQPTDRIQVSTDGLGPFTDFQFSSHVAWDPGEYQTLRVGVGTSSAGHFSNSVGYEKRIGQPPMIRAVLGNCAGGLVIGSVPAPPSGDHIFSLTRQGTLISAYFDGALIVQGVPDCQEPIKTVVMSFGSAGGAAFAPLHVDNVSLVPEPMPAIGIGIGFAAWCAFRRLVRRKSDGR